MVPSGLRLKQKTKKKQKKYKIHKKNWHSHIPITKFA